MLVSYCRQYLAAKGKSYSPGAASLLLPNLLAAISAALSIAPLYFPLVWCFATAGESQED